MGKSGFVCVLVFCMCVSCGSFMAFRDSQKAGSRSLASVDSFHVHEINKRSERLMGEGRQGHESQNYSQVIRSLSELLDLYPYTEFRDEASFLLAHAFFHKGEYNNSENVIRRLQEYHDGRSRWFGYSLLVLAKIHEQRGQTSEAMNLYKQVMTKYSSDRELASEAESFYGNIRGL